MVPDLPLCRGNLRVTQGALERERESGTGRREKSSAARRGVGGTGSENPARPDLPWFRWVPGFNLKAPIHIVAHRRRDHGHLPVQDRARRADRRGFRVQSEPPASRRYDPQDSSDASKLSSRRYDPQDSSDRVAGSAGAGGDCVAASGSDAKDSAHGERVVGGTGVSGEEEEIERGQQLRPDAVGHAGGGHGRS